MAKIKKTEDFIIYSSNLDEFVRIYNLDADKIDSCVSAIGELISVPNKTIRDYITYIVSLFVKNYEEYLDGDGDDETYDAMFEAVLEAYPLVQIDTICEVLNSKLFKGDYEGERNGPPKKSIGMKALQALRSTLKKLVVGQDEAVDEVVNSLKLRAAGFSKFSSFFFIGPTGVGKTEMARALSRTYLGSEKKLLKINCGEYSNPHEYSKLIGSPPGYIGFNEKGILSEKAAESSEWIILFDEIEKASGKLHNLLLGFLDDGIIQDNHGTELDFTESLVVFTSNIGMENVGKKTVGFDAKTLSYEDIKDDVMESFKGKFPPEFVNRIDKIVHFNQLTRDNTAEIAKLNLEDLPIKPTKKLIDYIVEGGYSMEYGARHLKRFIRQNVTLKLADAILKGPKYKRYTPVFRNGDLSVSGIEE